MSTGWPSWMEKKTRDCTDEELLDIKRYFQAGIMEDTTDSWVVFANNIYLANIEVAQKEIDRREYSRTARNWDADGREVEET